MIQLLLRGWFEPPNSAGLHLSTLVQQILSVISERGGAKASQLFSELITKGAFSGLSQGEFAELLRSLAKLDLIFQDSTGLLLLGQKGEQFVASYDFYAAFASSDEWQIVCDGRTMGSLPISSVITIGMRIIFGGRRWLVISVDDEAQIVSVRSDPGGLPPIFDSGRPSVHDIVRKEMRSVLSGSAPVTFLDSIALTLLAQAREQYQMLRLDQKQVIKTGTITNLFTWSGDSTNDTLALLLKGLGIAHADNEGLTVCITGSELNRTLDALLDISQLEKADLEGLLKDAHNMTRGKWDWALPESLLKKSFVSSHLSFTGARSAAAECLESFSDN